MVRSRPGTVSGQIAWSVGIGRHPQIHPEEGPSVCLVCLTVPFGQTTTLVGVREVVRMANRLAGATSPYLLQHKDNPVDWWEWGEEAFAEARRSDRPLLVSIGYAACHWCHVPVKSA